MKNGLKFICAAALVMSFAACRTNSPKEQQAKLNQQERVEQKQGQIPLTWSQQRDQYATEVSNRINDYNKRIGELNQSAAQYQGPEKSMRQNLANSLQDQVNVLQRDLSDLKTAQYDTWMDHKNIVEKDMAKADNVYNQAKQVATAK